MGSTPRAKQPDGEAGGRTPRATARIAVLLAMAALLTSPAAAQLQVEVGSANDFVRAVQQFVGRGSSSANSTTTLLLAPVINMTSALGTYPDANSSNRIAPGTLVLASARGPSARSLLDFGMQSGLTLPWESSTLRWQVRGGSQALAAAARARKAGLPHLTRALPRRPARTRAVPHLELPPQNLVLVNLCSEFMVWNPTFAIFIHSSSNTWLLPRSRCGGRADRAQ